jgi:hypothetical protein
VFYRRAFADKHHRSRHPLRCALPTELHRTANYPPALAVVVPGVLHRTGDYRTKKLSEKSHSGQPSEHEPAHRCVDEGLAGDTEPLIVSAEPAVLTQPRERPLHHPPPRQHTTEYFRRGWQSLPREPDSAPVLLVPVRDPFATWMWWMPMPEWGVRLGVPGRRHDWLHRLTGQATLPAVFSAGILVGLCTVPCSGAIYRGVLGLLATQATYAEGLAYLVVYNAIFVLPLVAMLAVASSRAVFNQLGRWQLHHRGGLELGLGLGAIALGLLLLVTL